MTGIPQPAVPAGHEPAERAVVEPGGSADPAELAGLVERAVRATGQVVDLYPPGGLAPRATAAGLERLGLVGAIPRVRVRRRAGRTDVEVAIGVRSSTPAPVAVRRVRAAIAGALAAVCDDEVVVRATVVHVVD